MSKAILTLPMMPVDGQNYGKYVTPIICETLRNILEGKYYHCINILDSFNDRTINLDNYVQSLNKNSIHYDELWYDNENIEKFIKNIDTLIDKGYITELYTFVYRCDCGIIEIEENKINTCNPNNLKFNIVDNQMICKHCGSVCKKYYEKVLAFYPKDVELSDIKILPRYLNKDAKTYIKTVLDSYTTISRNRDTSLRYSYNGNNYNIDVDFLWATYLNTFDEKEKLVVSGNKMLYQLFLTAVIEKCLEKENDTILVGTPYLTNIKNITNEPLFEDREKLRKLFIIFNTKWSKKEIMYDKTILNYLHGLSYQKINKLYEIVNSKEINDLDFYDNVDESINKHFNMQENVKKLKLERR